MSATKNTDSIQPGQQFSSRPDRRETEDAPKHQPGTHFSSKDAIPESTIEVLPPGTAPPSKTYTPNPDPTTEAARVADHVDDPANVDNDAPRASAADTRGGATSADVNTGLGKPMQGQTSNELRHEGQQQGGNKESKGLVGVGASGAAANMKQVDSHDPDMASQRALGKESVQPGNRGGQLSAQERLPTRSEEVASERK